MSTGQVALPFAQRHPQVASRGIDEATWNALCSSVYPGAKEVSILMAADYCKARSLDIMMKPVHLVPMNVKNAQTGQYEWRDVPMPGIGLYRIQADRSKTYAGADEPEFGPTIEQTFVDKNKKKITVKFPEWCKYTVHKIVGDHIVSFVAKEYWLENYATDGRDSDAPNSMWQKRSWGQIAKCAEAQALRRGWPEIGSEPTAEEMAGKTIHDEVDITPKKDDKPEPQARKPADEPTPADAANTQQAEAEPKQDAKKDKTGAVDAEFVECVNTGMIKSIKSALHRAGKSELALCQHFKVDSIESLPKSEINPALDWCKAE